VKRAAAIGVGSSLLLGVAWALPGLPQSPGEVITWVDAFSELVSRMGMPGTIVVLFASLLYHEFFKIPRMYTRQAEERREWATEKEQLRAEIRTRTEAEFAYREANRDRLEGLIKANTVATIQLHEAISRLHDALGEDEGDHS